MHLPTGIHRTFATILAVVLLTVAMAACSGDDDDDEDSAATVISRGSPTTSTTTTTRSSSGSTTATYSAPETTSTDDADDSAGWSGSASTSDSDDAAADSAPASPQPRSTVVGQQRARPAPTASPPATRAPAPQRSGPSSTTFRNYGRTPFVDASADAVSTFSLDTDRTSYFLALNWVRNGYAVAPDSVRAEEWVNAFAYHYDQPRDDLSFSIRSDVVAHPLGGGRHLARIGLQAPQLRDNTPLNVTLVLDASGSMAGGNRVDIARAAAETIRQSLGPRDRIAVVHFTTDVISRYTVEHSSPDNRDVARSIERLAPHNSTNVQAGLNRAVQLAEQARRDRPDAFNYIILMSDGVANVDATNPFAILESAPDRNHLNPLRLITIGVGIENYNDHLLEQLAQHGNGWYRLPGRHRAGALHVQPRELARALHAVRGPGARAGHMGPALRRVVAHRGLREPRHAGPHLRAEPQGVRGAPVGGRHDGVLRAGAARLGTQSVRGPGRCRGALGPPGDR